MSYTRQFDWEEEDPEATFYLTSALRIRLTDPDKNPLPQAKCRLAKAPEMEYTADGNGIVFIPVPEENSTGIDLEWEPADAENYDSSNRYYYRNIFLQDIPSIDDPICSTRLTNLGFEGATLIDQVVAYQNYFNRAINGDINDIREELVDWHEGGGIPTPYTLDESFPDETISSTEENDSPITHSLILQDYNLNPIASQKCIVSSLDGSTLFFDESTDENGYIEFTLDTPQDVTVAVFTDDQTAPAYEWEVAIEDVFPSATSIEGILYRLKNLGYYANTPTDEWGVEESNALQWFQMDHDLPDTGNYDDLTIAKLTEIYGS